MKFKHSLLATSAVLAAAISASSAHAAASAAASNNTIEELVVTAEKREQSLQDVPVAVSAFTSEKRDLVGINTVQDMTNFTPGLQYSTQTDRISLRGVGRLNNSHAADSSVAVYSDGIYTTSTVQAGETPIFIDRLEVLRGPQGTLYGRNSIGGAINVVSRKPTEQFYAEVRGTYANYDRRLLEAAVSGPITNWLQFRLAGNWEKQTDGWFKNINAKGGPDEGGIIDQTFLEGQLAGQFGEHIEAFLKVSLIHWDNGGGGPGSRSSYSPAPYNLAQQSQSNNLVPNAGFAYSGLATNVVNNGCSGVNPGSLDERKICVDTPGTVHLSNTIVVAANLVYHAHGFDVKYITGGTKYHYFLTGDQDGTGVTSYSTCYTLSAAARPACLAGTTAPINYPSKYAFDYQEKEQWYSHEINIVSTGDAPFQYLVGAYLYHETYSQPVFTMLENEARLGGFVVNAATGGAAPSDPLRHIYDDRPHLNLLSKAIFGQIDWAFMPKWKTTLGIRYGEDHKHGFESTRIIFAPGTLNATLPIDVTPVIGLAGGKGVVSTVYNSATGFKTRFYDDKWKAVTGTAGLQFNPTEETMFYAKYSRGYKAGGFRIGIDTSLGADPRTEKETLNSYEFGLKTTINHNLQIDGDIFYYDYKNAQVPLSQPSATAGGTANSVLFNVPKARSMGLEVETIWQPIDNLQILANYSYLDAEVRKGLAVDGADSCAQATGARRTVATAVADAFCGGPQYLQDLKGNSLPNSAKHRVTLNGNYTWRFDPGSVTASATYIWRGPQYGSIFDRSYYKAPSFDQVDARLTFKAKGDKFTAIAFAKNIFDTKGYANGTLASRRAGTTPTQAALTGVFGQSSAYELNPPRTYGVELQYRF
ncbi:TonB-dependent receptor [Phenylobacterium sp.]|uniref:TonB-dependent receptor n=1 Tax=Phenylobacterium sp. TaxID=1871053 RepID=UPI0025D4FBC2|nr:TonB-dependent receptor [Phenylobacterium sp.]